MRKPWSSSAVIITVIGTVLAPNTACIATGGRITGITMEPDGSIRSVYNRGEDGSYTIRDGRFVRNGKPTPLLRKCD